MESMCLAVLHMRADRKRNKGSEKEGKSKGKMRRLIDEITVNSAD